METFLAENKEIILTILSCIATCATGVVTALKILADKKNKKLGNVNKALEGAVFLSSSYVPELVEFIEKVYPVGNGEIKREYVRNQVYAYCKGEQIIVNEQLIEDVIDQCVVLLNNKKNAEGINKYLKK